MFWLLFCEPVIHCHTKQDVLTDLDAFGFPRDYAVWILGNKLDLSLSFQCRKMSHKSWVMLLGCCLCIWFWGALLTTQQAQPCHHHVSVVALCGTYYITSRWKNHEIRRNSWCFSDFCIVSFFGWLCAALRMVCYPGTTSCRKRNADWWNGWRSFLRSCPPSSFCRYSKSSQIIRACKPCINFNFSIVSSVLWCGVFRAWYFASEGFACQQKQGIFLLQWVQHGISGGVLQPSNMFAVLCLKARKGEQFEVNFQ